MLHSSTIEDDDLSQALRLAMAALGARDLDRNADSGSEFFHEAQHMLAQTNLGKPDGHLPQKQIYSFLQAKLGLRHLQCQVLLIEFAAWSDIQELREWAIRETKTLAMV